MAQVRQSNKLVLHYYLRENSHSINSILRNECEREILSIIEELSKSFSIQISIETEPTEEGGFKETWKAIGTNAPQVSLIVSVLAIILTRFPIENDRLTQLQIENLELDNKIKRQQLKKLNLEFLNEEKLTDTLIKDSIEFIQQDYKISWRRSNFYKKLSEYKKVDSISVQRYNDKKPVGNERKVPKKEFSDFALKSDDLPTKELQSQKIDIISPVIKTGKFRWKGFYNRKIIDFEMADESFSLEVLRGDYKLYSKFSIEVDMVQKRAIDKDGGIKVTSHVVNTVTATYDGSERIKRQVVKLT